jgi:nitrite reductase (NO-forming)
MLPTSRRELLQAVGLGGAAAVSGCVGEKPPVAAAVEDDPVLDAARSRAAESVAADPTDVPEPVSRSRSTTVEVDFEIREVVSEVEDGKTYNYLTYDGQVPGPMVRVREGDTVRFTLSNPPASDMSHNVDFHAVYGTGGGSVATTAAPGEQNALEFTAEYPGAFIYHCAVPRLDYHISAGMFGMILVEPAEGLPEVDRELYFGQHELYTTGDSHQSHDMESMVDETPSYVLFNGEAYAYTADKYGPLEVDQGDTVRVFLVNGGPNLPSHFHPIGNVWSRAYRDGALPSDGVLDSAESNVQTLTIPPGSCMVGEMETPVPERIHLVDHALSRVRHKGVMADVDVRGKKRPETFDPAPGTASSKDEPGPAY